MQGLLDDLQRCDLVRMMNEIGSADPRPTITSTEEDRLRELWKKLQPITSADFAAVKMIHGRLKPPLNGSL